MANGKRTQEGQELQAGQRAAEGTRYYAEGAWQHTEGAVEGTSHHTKGTAVKKSSKGSKSGKGNKGSKIRSGKKNHTATQNGGSHNPYWAWHCRHFSFNELSKQGYRKSLKDSDRKGGKDRYGKCGGQFRGKHISRGIPRRGC